MLTKRMEKKAWRQLQKNTARNIEQVNPQNGSCMDNYRPSRKFPKLNEPDIRDTAGEVKTNS